MAAVIIDMQNAQQRKFEGHITVDIATGNSWAMESLCHHWGVSFSKIDGDPVLGKKVYAYANFYGLDPAPLEKIMREFANVLRGNGHTVVRLKIEEIILDERY